LGFFWQKPRSAKLEVETGLNQLKMVKTKMLVLWEDTKNSYFLQQLLII